MYSKGATCGHKGLESSTTNTGAVACQSGPIDFTAMHLKMNTVLVNGWHETVGNVRIYAMDAVKWVLKTL